MFAFLWLTSCPTWCRSLARNIAYTAKLSLHRKKGCAVCCSECCVVCSQANETIGQHGSVLVKQADRKTWLRQILQWILQYSAPWRSCSGGGCRRMTTFQCAGRPPVIHCTHCVTAFRPAAEVSLHRTIRSHLVYHYHTIITTECLSECLMHHIVPLRYVTRHHQSIKVKLTGLSRQWHKVLLPLLQFCFESTTHQSSRSLTFWRSWPTCVTISFRFVKPKQDSIKEVPSILLCPPVKPVYIHRLCYQNH